MIDLDRRALRDRVGCGHGRERMQRRHGVFLGHCGAERKIWREAAAPITNLVAPDPSAVGGDGLRDGPDSRQRRLTRFSDDSIMTGILLREWRMHPRDWQWKWIFWQVIAPILGPILISAVVVFLWQSGQPKFQMDWAVILDVSPWALTFYTITLIGATMNDLWPKLGDHSALGGSLIVVAISVALYASFIVIWRHDPNFVPGTAVYAVTLLLLGISVVLCHQAAKA